MNAKFNNINQTKIIHFLFWQLIIKLVAQTFKGIGWVPHYFLLKTALALSLI